MERARDKIDREREREKKQCNLLLYSRKHACGGRKER
jgi:hypothetical protein